MWVPRRRSYPSRQHVGESGKRGDGVEEPWDLGPGLGLGLFGCGCGRGCKMWMWMWMRMRTWLWMLEQPSTCPASV